MSFAIGLGAALFVCVVLTLIAGQICHIGDLEKNPID
jgi:hypothetical protein